jgi:Sulfotransferase family
MPEHVHVFLAGLHRSGTSLLTQALADHPDASTFSATGFPEDEGQFLQRVFPIAKIYGGAGRFGFHPQSHLTERSPLATAENGIRLRSEWSRHWDLSKRVLIEKSPPNLLKLRFLQQAFPEAIFVVAIRHPIAVALATQKWSRTSTHSLIRHWLACYETFLRDAPSIRRLILVRYEALVAETELLARLQGELGVTPFEARIERRSGVNEKYFERWAGEGLPRRAFNAAVARRYERRANRFGYSLTTPRRAVVPRPEVRRLLAAGAA